MTSRNTSDIPHSRLLRDRILFHTGILLTILGGPVLALGSLAHDRFRIPVVGEAYDVFGWLNETYLIVGIVVLLIGAGLVAFSLKGGLLSRRTDTEGL